MVLARSPKLLHLTLLAVGTLMLMHGTMPAAGDVRPLQKAVGTVRGKVTFHGSQRKLPAIEISKDIPVCGRSKNSPRLIVGARDGVANAVVYLENPAVGKTTTHAGKARLSQKKCEYSPHLILVPLGSPLEIVNEDPVLHNVHAYHGDKTGGTAFNIAQPVRGQHTLVRETSFSHPGFYPVTCDAGHPWMSAYIVVTDHPYYAVTDTGGEFILRDVPAGIYRLTMWHEGVSLINSSAAAGSTKSYQYEEPYTQTREITIPPSGEVNLDFDFSLR